MLSASSTLFPAITRAAQEKGITLEEVASRTGLSCADLFHLQHNIKNPQNVDRSVINAVATFLNAPAVSIMLALGGLAPEDFFIQGEAHRAQELDSAINVIQNDRTWGNKNMQLFVVRAYEMCTGNALLPTPAAAASA